MSADVNCVADPLRAGLELHDRDRQVIVVVRHDADAFLPRGGARRGPAVEGRAGAPAAVGRAGAPAAVGFPVARAIGLAFLGAAPGRRLLGRLPCADLCDFRVRSRWDSVAKLGCICQRGSSVSFCRALVPLSH
jgi:hypothetical protein